MSLVSLFYKVRAVIGRIILRRKKIHKIDFPISMSICGAI